MRSGANKLFGVIRDRGEFLLWLHEEESPTFKEMPEKYKDDFKQLDKLGIVYKRNNREMGIRWQRIRRLIERDTIGDTNIPADPQLLLEYLSIEATPQTSTV